MLLKSIARVLVKYAGNAAGFGVAGDCVLAIYDLWHPSAQDPQQKRTEVEQLAAQPPDETHRQVAEIVAQEAAGQPETVRQAVTAYLTQVPNAIRQSQRRPQDPSGRSLSAILSLRGPEDLRVILPPRLPRFKAGDRPPGIGDWELEKLLGMGGFGEVWKARNPYLQPVALKFCLDPEAAKVLRNEAVLLGRVQQSQGQLPRIVRLLDTYLTVDPPCLKYEYVAGGDLTELLHKLLHRNQGKMPPGQVRKIVLSLAHTMTHAHRLKPPIVHRDLKPANILVERLPEGKARFHITDFGIGGAAASQAIEQAREASTAHFQATALRGAHTPLYASPQQMGGANPDPRDDVFALGVIWYQMLAGDLSKGAPHGIGWMNPFREQGMAPAELELLQSCFEDAPQCRPADAGVLAQRMEELDKQGLTGTEPPRPISPLVEDRLTSAVELTEQLAASEPPKTIHESPPPGPKASAAPKQLTNSIGMEFVRVPAGKFLMGSPVGEQGRYEEEGPQREVEISKAFYLGAYPVTQEQYERIMGTNPSYFAAGGGGSDKVKGQADTRELPAEHVTWTDAVEFCRRLSALPEEQRAGRVYELPTEAEWEYACRAGTTTPFHFGAELNGRQANCNGRHPYGTTSKGPYLGRTCVVGKYAPNAWGLSDMHGNVWEWCRDWYSDEYYRSGANKDPQGHQKGESRVLRGGSWYSPAGDCRAAFRSESEPLGRHFYAGCRLCLRLAC